MITKSQFEFHLIKQPTKTYVITANESPSFYTNNLNAFAYKRNTLINTSGLAQHVQLTKIDQFWQIITENHNKGYHQQSLNEFRQKNTYLASSEYLQSFKKSQKTQKTIKNNPIFQENNKSFEYLILCTPEQQKQFEIYIQKFYCLQAQLNHQNQEILMNKIYDNVQKQDKDQFLLNQFEVESESYNATNKQQNIYAPQEIQRQEKKNSRDSQHQLRLLSQNLQASIHRINRNSLINTLCKKLAKIDQQIALKNLQIQDKSNKFARQFSSNYQSQLQLFYPIKGSINLQKVSKRNRIVLKKLENKLQQLSLERTKLFKQIRNLNVFHGSLTQNPLDIRQIKAQRKKEIGKFNEQMIDFHDQQSNQNLMEDYQSIKSTKSIQKQENFFICKKKIEEKNQKSSKQNEINLFPSQKWGQ